MPGLKKQIPQLLAVFVFIVGGITALGDGDPVIGYVSIIIGLINLLAIFLDDRFPYLFPPFLLLLDAIAAIIIAVMLTYAGKRYIHFAWYLITLLYAFAFVVILKKALSNKKAAAAVNGGKN